MRFYKVKYEGIIAKYDPAFEKTAERHDAILPTHYKLLAYHKGYPDARSSRRRTRSSK